MNHKGILRWPDGREYRGSYYMGKKQGFGIFRYSDGREYQGYFQAGKQVDIAELKNCDGSTNFKQW